MNDAHPTVKAGSRMCHAITQANWKRDRNTGSKLIAQPLDGLVASGLSHSGEETVASLGSHDRAWNDLALSAGADASRARRKTAATSRPWHSLCDSSGPPPLVCPLRAILGRAEQSPDGGRATQIADETSIQGTPVQFLSRVERIVLRARGD